MCFYLSLSSVFYSLGHKVECSVSKECTPETGTLETGTPEMGTPETGTLEMETPSMVAKVHPAKIRTVAR